MNKNGNPVEVVYFETRVPNAACGFTRDEAAGWHCGQTPRCPDAPELQPTNPSEARKQAQILQSGASM